jgi:hypothetical protein
MKAKQVSAPKVEPKARAMNVAAVAQEGLAVQFRKPNLETGAGYSGGKVGATGIAGARHGPPGVGPGGGGRTIYKSGSQSPTPPAREMPAGREYGKDIPGRRGR